MLLNFRYKCLEEDCPSKDLWVKTGNNYPSSGFVQLVTISGFARDFYCFVKGSVDRNPGLLTPLFPADECCFTGKCPKGVNTKAKLAVRPGDSLLLRPTYLRE